MSQSSDMYSDSQSAFAISCSETDAAVNGLLNSGWQSSSPNHDETFEEIRVFRSSEDREDLECVLAFTVDENDSVYINQQVDEAVWMENDYMDNVKPDTYTEPFTPVIQLSSYQAIPVQLISTSAKLGELNSCYPQEISGNSQSIISGYVPHSNANSHNIPSVLASTSNYAQKKSSPNAIGAQTKLQASSRKSKCSRASSRTCAKVKTVCDDIGAGLQNLGNTCFLNATIQCLTYTSPLLEVLLQSNEDCYVNGVCLMCELSRLVRECLSRPGGVYPPHSMLQKLKLVARHMRWGRQEDAHEFLRFFVDALHKSCISGHRTISECNDGAKCDSNSVQLNEKRGDLNGNITDVRKTDIDSRKDTENTVNNRVASVNGNSTYDCLDIASWNDNYSKACSLSGENISASKSWRVDKETNLNSSETTSYNGIFLSSNGNTACDNRNGEFNVPSTAYSDTACRIDANAFDSFSTAYVSGSNDCKSNSDIGCSGISSTWMSSNNAIDKTTSSNNDAIDKTTCSDHWSSRDETANSNTFAARTPVNSYLKQEPANTINITKIEPTGRESSDSEDRCSGNMNGYCDEKNDVKSEKLLNIPTQTSTESTSAVSNSFINDVFAGILRSQVSCLECGWKSNTFDPFLDLCLDVRNSLTLEKAFDKFVQPEVLETENAYYCNRCCKKVNAEKQFTLNRLPTILNIQLKRYSVLGGKVTQHIIFPELLDVKPYMSSNALQSDIAYDENHISNHCASTMHNTNDSSHTVVTKLNHSCDRTQSCLRLSPANVISSASSTAQQSITNNPEHLQSSASTPCRYAISYCSGSTNMTSDNPVSSLVHCTSRDSEALNHTITSYKASADTTSQAVSCRSADVRSRLDNIFNVSSNYQTKNSIFEPAGVLNGGCSMSSGRLERNIFQSLSSLEDSYDSRRTTQTLSQDQSCAFMNDATRSVIGGLNENTCGKIEALDDKTCNKTGDSSIYTLYAVLVHEGHSTNSGHYYCYVRTLDDLHWYCMNDSMVRRVSLQQVLNAEAYLLFYRKTGSELKAVNNSIQAKADQYFQKQKNGISRYKELYQSGRSLQDSTNESKSTGCSQRASPLSNQIKLLGSRGDLICGGGQISRRPAVYSKVSSLATAADKNRTVCKSKSLTAKTRINNKNSLIWSSTETNAENKLSPGVGKLRNLKGKSALVSKLKTRARLQSQTGKYTTEQFVAGTGDPSVMLENKGIAMSYDHSNHVANIVQIGVNGQEHRDDVPYPVSIYSATYKEPLVMLSDFKLSRSVKDHSEGTTMNESSASSRNFADYDTSYLSPELSTSSHGAVNGMRHFSDITKQLRSASAANLSSQSVQSASTVSCKSYIRNIDSENFPLELIYNGNAVDRSDCIASQNGEHRKRKRRKYSDSMRELHSDSESLSRLRDLYRPDQRRSRLENQQETPAAGSAVSLKIRVKKITTNPSGSEIYKIL